MQTIRISYPVKTGLSHWQAFFSGNDKIKKVGRGINSADHITLYRYKEQSMILDKDSIVFTPKPTIHNFIDHTGDVFGRLTVIGYAGQYKAPAWYCQCECGNITSVPPSNLRAGVIRSCGCLKTELWLIARTKHGECVNGGSDEYNIYQGAKSRCTNPNDTAYHNYGERGIEFRFTSFEEFLDTLGRRPSKEYTVDRIDNDGHYEVGNVKWATVPEQASHKRNTRHITLNGITKCARQWARDIGMKYMTVYARIRYGWCDECILTLPLRQQCSHRE